MIAAVRLAGRAAEVQVRFSDHAIYRFVERLRPGIGESEAAKQLQLLAPNGEVQVGSPTWGRRPTAFLYLVIGDACFPLDADRHNPERLVAMTCIVRGMPPKSHRGRATRNRQRKARLAQASTSDNRKAA